MARVIVSLDQAFRNVVEIVSAKFAENTAWDLGRKPEDSGGAEQFDYQKSVDTWASWMELKAHAARVAAFGSKDKSAALKLILEAVVLGITCLVYNRPPED